MRGVNRNRNNKENMRSNKNVSIVSNKILNKIKQGIDVQFPTPDSVVMSASSLNSLRNNSRYVSSEEYQQQKRITISQQQARNKKAQLRKQKMLKQEEEKRNRKKSQQNVLTETEALKLKEQQKHINNAKDKMIQNHDCVKQMESLVLYAKCAAIRDRQIKEKEAIKKEEESYNKQLDEMMEIDRINEIDSRNRKIRQSAQATRQSALVIQQQLKQNERAKMLQKEQKRLEGEAMRKKLAKLEEIEQQKQKQKIATGKKLLADIKQANEQIAQVRVLEKQRQKLEDEKIAKYLKEKDDREQMLILEQKKLEAQKERQKNKIREQQEKVADHAKQREDVIIRRAQEERERRWRAKQLEEAKKQAESKTMLAEARDRARLEKDLRLAEQAAQERLEFDKNVQAYHSQQADIESERNQKAMKSVQYRETLQSQIKGKQDLLQKNEKLDTRRKTLLEQQHEHEQLEQIKQQKMKELQKCGVPSKYMVDLQKFQFQS